MTEKHTPILRGSQAFEAPAEGFGTETDVEIEPAESEEQHDER